MEEKPRKRHLIQRRKCGKKYGDTAILEERAEQEILEIIRILICLRKHSSQRKKKTHKEGHSKGIQHKHEKEFEKVSGIWRKSGHPVCS